MLKNLIIKFQKTRRQFSSIELIEHTICGSLFKKGEILVAHIQHVRYIKHRAAIKPYVLCTFFMEIALKDVR